MAASTAINLDILPGSADPGELRVVVVAVTRDPDKEMQDKFVRPEKRHPQDTCNRRL